MAFSINIGSEELTDQLNRIEQQLGEIDAFMVYSESPALSRLQINLRFLSPMKNRYKPAYQCQWSKTSCFATKARKESPKGPQSSSKSLKDTSKEINLTTLLKDWVVNPVARSQMCLKQRKARKEASILSKKEGKDQSLYDIRRNIAYLAILIHINSSFAWEKTILKELLVSEHMPLAP